MTLNQLSLILENTIKNHLQIQDYYFGDVFDINTRENNYVLFNYSTTSFNLGDNMSTFNFDFYLFDKLKEDESNLLDIQSDLTQILNDIIFSIKYNYEYYIDIKSVNPYSYFKDQFTDYLAGVNTTVEIEIKNNSGNCDIPLLSGNTIHLTSYDYTLGYNEGYMDGLEQSGTISHTVLTDRANSDQHPIGAITGLQTQITYTNSSLTYHQSEIDLLSQNLQDTNQDILNLENEVLSLSSYTINEFTNVNNNIITNVNSINNLNNSAITNKNNISTLSSFTHSNINSLNSSITYHQSEIDSSNLAINNLNNSAITNKNNISSLSATTINLQYQIDNFSGSSTVTGVTIANVTGLQTELNNRSITGHTHIISNITGLQTELNNSNNAINNLNNSAITNKNNISILSGAGFITNTNDYLDFNAITGITYKSGRVYFDSVEDAFTYYNSKSEISMQIGREIWVKVRNVTGTQINNGQAVYISGTYNDIVTIDLADCSSYIKSRIIGIATMDIPSDVNGFGYVTFFGRVNEINTTLYPNGSILYLKMNYPGDLTNLLPSDGCYKTRIGIVSKSDVLGSIEVNVLASEYTVEVLGETGFPDASQVSMSFIESARTFKIQPNGTEYRYYEVGEKYNKTIKDELVISDVEGNHFIYFTGSTLNDLVNGTSSQISSVIKHHATTAYIYWNATDKKAEFVGKELHNSIGYGVQNHIVDHLTVGAKYGTGLGINNINSAGNGSLNSHAQFGVGTGSIYDEDILHTINAVSATTGYVVRYTSSNNLPRSIRYDGMPVMTGGTGRIVYNPIGSNLVEVTNTNYVWYHLFASGDLNNSNSLSTFVGRSQFTTTTLAYAGLNNDIASVQLNGLPSPEFKAIASILYQTNNSYSNIVKARIRPANTDGADYIDWRRLTVAGFGVGGGGAVSTSVFSDADFQIYDNNDITKIVQFEVSNVVGTNSISITKAGTLAMLSDLSATTSVTGVTINDVEGLQIELNNRSITGHTHTASNIIDLNNVLSNYLTTGYTDNDIIYITGVTGLQTELNNRSITGHTHIAANLPSTIVYTSTANTFADFDQSFRSNRLLIRNPANTFGYSFTSAAIAANRIITLPLLTAGDTMAVLAFAQTFTNKTLVATSNTITDTSAVLGDLFKFNGTRFVRFPKGLANQILVTNTAATDLVWSSGLTINQVTNLTTELNNRSITGHTHKHSNITDWDSVLAGYQTTGGTSGSTASIKLSTNLSPGQAELTGASDEPLLVGIKGTNTSWSELQFDDTTVQNARYVISNNITANYKNNSISFNIFWKATGTTGDVKWQIKLLARTSSDNIDTAYDTTVHTGTTTVNGTTNLLNITTITFTPNSNELVANELLLFQLTRVANDGADTMTGDANVVSISIIEN